MRQPLRFICLPLLFAAPLSADDWPAWRGPEGSGHSKESALPVHWSAKSIVWQTPLPGEKAQPKSLPRAS